MFALTLKFKCALVMLLGATLAPAALAQTPSAAEQADLQFMREEEKLARDVYASLGAKWQLNPFLKIQRSEQQHIDTVSALLNQYGIHDPAAALPVGQFANPELQTLHAELLKEGSLSRIAALKVGAAIEEIDIRDLDERITRTNTPDIRFAYENLRRASWNHLAAFTRSLKSEGVTYTPQYLDTAEYSRQIAIAR